MREWGKIAHEHFHQMRMEVLVMDNQRHFMEMMKEAEEDGKLLIQVEVEKAKQLREKKLADIEAAKQITKEANIKRVQEAKRDDKRMVCISFIEILTNTISLCTNDFLNDIKRSNRSNEMDERNEVKHR